MRQVRQTAEYPQSPASSPVQPASPNPSFTTGGTRVLHVFEEVCAGVEHHHVALVLEALAIGLHAAVEGIEFRVLVIRGSVDRRSLGFALALDALGIAI